MQVIDKAQFTKPVLTLQNRTDHSIELIINNYYVDKI